jgi:hypothetical protein
VTRAAYRRALFGDLAPALLRPDALAALERGARLDPEAARRDATPVEFSHAVARFGHALVRPDYALGATVNRGDAVGLHSLLSHTPRRAVYGPWRPWAIEWARFFGPAAQRAAAFSPRVSPFLAEAPTIAGARAGAPRAPLLRADLGRSADPAPLSAAALARRVAPFYGPAALGWLAFDAESRAQTALCWLAWDSAVEPTLAELAEDPPLLFLTLLEAAAPAAEGGGDGRRLGALGSAVFGDLMFAARDATRAAVEDHPELPADERAVWGPGPPPARMTDLIAAVAAPFRGEPR